MQLSNNIAEEISSATVTQFHLIYYVSSVNVFEIRHIIQWKLAFTKVIGVIISLSTNLPLFLSN